MTEQTIPAEDWHVQSILVPITRQMHALMHEQHYDHPTYGRNPTRIKVNITFPLTLLSKISSLNDDHEFAIDYIYMKRFERYTNTNNPILINDKPEYPFSNTGWSNTPVAIKTNRVSLEETIIAEIQNILSTDPKSLPNPFDVSAIITDFLTPETITDEIKHRIEEAEKIRQDEYRKEVEAKEKVRQEQERAKIERENKIQAENEQINRWRAAWIERCGSDRLKIATRKGYNCIKQFVTEFVETEFDQNFIHDANNDIKFKERSCPTLKALLKVEEFEKIDAPGVAIKIVWLPYGTEVDEYGDATNEGEAIEIKLLDNYFYLPTNILPDNA